MEREGQEVQRQRVERENRVYREREVDEGGEKGTNRTKGEMKEG